MRKMLTATAVWSVEKLRKIASPHPHEEEEEEEEGAFRYVYLESIN
jgi:hypothetical protein